MNVFGQFRRLPSYLRSLLTWNKFPPYLRNIIRTIIYGLVAGLAAVLFQKSINFCDDLIWEKLRHSDVITFAWISFLIISISSLLAGILMTKVSPDAAGSGIPQLKLAFWQSFGRVPLRAVFVKFLGGILTIGGGASMGREGPTVYIGGALCSNIAGAMGVAKQGRRAASAAGAAAGLAAAFNTPLSSITFVLEEIIEDLNNGRYLVYTLIAAVLATFITHIFIGTNPAFEIAQLSSVSYKIYLLVPLIAAAAAVAGMVFQRFTLDWRSHIKTKSKIPTWLRPAVGVLVTWALGVAVFAWCGSIGVFGLGYHALTDMLNNNMVWYVALVLFVAKLLATISAYSWGGCGGIFAPTLFIGAAVAVAITGMLDPVMSISGDEHILLAVLGMSACLGAVVRAPITSILIVFEMTHEFKFVPALMLGTVVSQAVSRMMAKDNFYTEALSRDGHNLEKIIPPRTLNAWQKLEVGTIANFNPISIALSDLTKGVLAPLLAAHPYNYFPVIEQGKCAGLISRQEAQQLIDHDIVPQLHPAPTLTPEAPITQARDQLISNVEGVLILVNANRDLIGLLTLHDLLRAEMKALEAQND